MIKIHECSTVLQNVKLCWEKNVKYFLKHLSNCYGDIDHDGSHVIRQNFLLARALQRSEPKRLDLICDWFATKYCPQAKVRIHWRILERGIFPKNSIEGSQLSFSFEFTNITESLSLQQSSI